MGGDNSNCQDKARLATATRGRGRVLYSRRVVSIDVIYEMDVEMSTNLYTASDDRMVELV